MMLRSILLRFVFPSQKQKNKKTRFTALIVMSESCSANNWRLLKKEKGSHDVTGEYSRFTRSPVGPPKFEVGAKILILLTMSICYPAANLTISQCSWEHAVANHPTRARSASYLWRTDNVYGVDPDSPLGENQTQILPCDNNRHFNDAFAIRHSPFGIIEWSMEWREHLAQAIIQIT